MQKLIFEAAWDKTIAPEDRLTIEELFHQSKDITINKIKTLPINQAFNHKEDLLVIVLIHNFSDDLFSFDKIEATYLEDVTEIATHHFSFPKLELEANTSMPWTFIFPKHSQLAQASLKNGILKIST